MAYKVIAIRGLQVPVIGEAKNVHTIVHRYEDGGGVDVPLTNALFTVQGRHHEETGFARDLRVTTKWRAYAVYISHPARIAAWGGEVLIFKRGYRGHTFVNMRREDRRAALKVARRALRAAGLVIPQSART